MANLKSSKKDVRRTKKRTQQNKVFKDNMKAAVKNFKRLGESSKEDIASLYKALDKAVKKGVIKKGTAARKKSRLTKSKVA
jgi:small subunit ribosomal protein S20